MEKSTIAAVQKVLPLGGRLKLTDVRSRLGRVQRSLTATGIGGGGRAEGRESEEEESDLRDLLNKKKEKNNERYVCVCVCVCVCVRERESGSSLCLERAKSVFISLYFRYFSTVSI